MMIMDSIQLHFPSLRPVNQFHHQTSNVRHRRTPIKSIQLQCSGEDEIGNALSCLRKAIYKKDIKLGSCIHAKTMKVGLGTDVFVANSILDMYVKCGRIEDAEMLFEEMPYRTVVSWTCMMWGYCQRGLAEQSMLLYRNMVEFLQPNEHTLAVLMQACAQSAGGGRLFQGVHGYAIKCGFLENGFLQNCLIDEYTKHGMLEDGERLLERWHDRDVVSWTCLISGCVAMGMVERALALFFRMQEDGVVPNEITILSVLKACSSYYRNSRLVRSVHGVILKAEWQKYASIFNSLVETYSTNDCFGEATKLFCEFCFTGEEGLYLNSKTMANFIQVCGHSGSLRLVEEVHGYLIKNGYFPCMIIENSLIDVYAVNEKDSSAFLVFMKMSTKDIISWNTMIKCLVKNGQPSKALSLLSEIHITGAKDMILPDFVTMLASLGACSDMAALLQGQVIHGYITKTGFLSDIFIQNSLIDMYSKSGELDFADRIFKDMKDRDLGSWNSIIAAHGSHGHGTSALELFAELNHQPNAITLSNILSACAHAGLVKEGLEIFNRIKKEYHLEPSPEHYACIVDLLGRSGKIYEATAFVSKMPSSCPNPDVWGTLLGVCQVFDNMRIAEKAAKELAILEPNSCIWRIALSNVYAKVGRWSEVAKLRGEIQRSKDINKGGGWSFLNVKGCEYKFIAGDTKNAGSENIYQTLNMIHRHMIDQTW